MKAARATGARGQASHYTSISEAGLDHIRCRFPLVCTGSLHASSRQFLPRSAFDRRNISTKMRVSEVQSIEKEAMAGRW